MGQSRVPFLAGQHVPYIVHQLERFATDSQVGDDHRADAGMSSESHGLSPADRQRVAEALSNQVCANTGDTGLAAFTPNPCAECHGARGISNDSQIPNLAGQDVRYMIEQYNLFRAPHVDWPGNDGARSDRHRHHPLMGPLATETRDRVVAIMSYYARLPCR